MSYAIDIILVAVIAFIAFLSAKRGLILTLCDLVSSLLAFVAAKVAAPYAADFVYEAFVKEKVIEFLTEKYSLAEGAIQATAENIFSAFDFLPDGIMSYLNTSGFLDSQNISQSVMSSITSVEQLENSVVAPVMLSVITLLCFAAISFVALIAFRFIGRAVSKLISKLKIIGSLNTALGGILGIVKGVIYVFIIAVVITVLSFTNETIASYAASSYICSFAASLLGL